MFHRSTPGYAALPPLNPVEASGIRRVREEELLRAVPHYRRALASLKGGGFEYLSAALSSKLEEHLRGELRTIKAELRRRALQERCTAAARSRVE
jgi:hypothetical protein